MPTKPLAVAMTANPLDAIPPESIPAAIVHLAARAMTATETSSKSDEVSDDLLTVPQAAKLLGVSPNYVFNHARELGVIRLGSGPKARLRFSKVKVLRRLAA